MADLPALTLPSPGSGFSQALARNRLPASSIVLFVLGAAAPFTVIAGVVPTGFAVTGVTGLPVAFLAIGAVLGVFCVGYLRMARHVGNAGAFYSMITHGLGRVLGVAAAWVALIAYTALTVGLYGAFGAIGVPLLQQWVGISGPWWLLTLPVWALVAVLGVLRVDINGRVLAVLLLAEIAAILTLSITGLRHPAEGISLTTVNPASLVGPGAGALFALGLLGFVGFEQPVVFSEEARDPQRSVPRAAYAGVAIIAVLYGFSSWAITMYAGPTHVVQQAREQGPELVFGIATTHLGTVVADVVRGLFVTSLFAAMIVFHNTTARYAFALGREGVLPPAVGRTSRRSGAPKIASILQSLIGLIVIVGYGLAGWDPLLHLFYWAGTTGGLGVLLLVTTTAFAILGYYLHHHNHAGDQADTHPGSRKSAGQGGRQGGRGWLIVPLLAALALTWMSWTALTNLDILLNVPPGSILTRAVPLGYLTVAVLGAGWALYRRAFTPQVYAAIGTGTRPTPTPAPHPQTGGADPTNSGARTGTTGGGR